MLAPNMGIKYHKHTSSMFAPNMGIKYPVFVISMFAPNMGTCYKPATEAHPTHACIYME